MPANLIKARTLLDDAMRFRIMWTATRHPEHFGAYRACVRLARRANGGA